MHFDAVCGEYAGGFLGKHIGFYPRIIRYGNTAVCKMLIDIIRQPLCGTANGIDIQPVCACADYTAQSARAKLQIAVETILNCGGISCYGL